MTYPIITVADCITAASRAHDISEKAILSPARYREIVYARNTAIGLAAKLTGKSMPQIGREIGGKDHTTVLHAIRRCRFLRETDPEFRDQYDAARRFLPGRGRANLHGRHGEFYRHGALTPPPPTAAV